MSANPSPLPPAFREQTAGAASALPPAFAQSASAQAPSEWARAVMPDGSVVEDRASTLDGKGMAPQQLVWRTEGAKKQGTAVPKLAAMLAALIAIAAYYAARLANADALTSLAVFAGAFVIGFPAFFLGIRFGLRKQISGEGAISVMYLPPTIANVTSVGSLVTAAASAQGRQARGPKSIRGVQYWDLDVPVRFYLNPMFGPSRTFLSIKTGSRANADLYRRLKGNILAMLAQMQPAFPAPPAYAAAPAAYGGQAAYPAPHYGAPPPPAYNPPPPYSPPPPPPRR